MPRLPLDPLPAEEGSKPFLLNALLAKNPHASRYLEVGVRRGRTLSKISAAHKVGVDPNPLFDTKRLPPGITVHVETSDEFFKANDESFDVVFIDGLHTFEQTAKDIVNSLETLSGTGVVVIDDCWPADTVTANPDMHETVRLKGLKNRSDPGWYGDVWKVIPWLDSESDSLAVSLIGKRGAGTLVVWRKKQESDFLTRLKERSKEFAEIDSSVLFSGDFESIDMATTTPEAVSMEYEHFCIGHVQ